MDELIYISRIYIVSIVLWHVVCESYLMDTFSCKFPLVGLQLGSFIFLELLKKWIIETNNSKND